MVQGDMGLYASCQEHVNHIVVELHAQLVDLQSVCMASLRVLHPRQGLLLAFMVSNRSGITL